LIDVVIDEKAKLFISAIGVPPVDVVKKLHDAGIIVMNVSDLRLAAHSWELMTPTRWSVIPSTFRKRWLLAYVLLPLRGSVKNPTERSR
jgi:hypothetical protein